MRVAWLITGFFFLSGSTALVYQVVWVRMLGLVVGHSALAISTVVATFMAGLGLGARFGGAWASSVRRPLMAYGVLECVIAGFALLVPLILAGGQPVIGAISQGRVPVWAVLALSVVALLPATLCMGATLPLLTCWYARAQDSLGRDMGWLYAVNTTGAVVGAAMCGFVLLPALGQRGTIGLAVGINLLVGLGAILLGRTHALVPAEPSPRTPPPKAAPPRAGQGSATAILWAFAISGAAAMVNQVAWTRSFELFTGTTTYAFSLIVCAFIGGLALGGHLFAQVVDRISDRSSLLALINLGIAASCAALIPILGELPLWMVGPLSHTLDSFLASQALTLGVLACLVLLPTVLMGGTYTVATRALVSDPEQAPATVGRAYLWNTVGALCGAVAVAHVLIPQLGLQDALWLAVGLNALGATVLWVGQRKWALVLPVLAAAGLGLAPDWNPRHMNLAPYLYAGDLSQGQAALDRATRSGSLLFHEEGTGATVSVLQRRDGARVLRINGKTDASTTEDAMTQSLLGHLPLLLAEHQDSALVVGLGSGMSVQAVLEHGASRVVVAELLPEVARAAAHFGPLLGDPLDDPATELFLGDARPLLNHGNAQYDAVISEPTNIFIAGLASLFTIEAFEAMKRGRAPGGVAVVWLQGYLLPEADFRTVVRTFLTVFPEGSLWVSGTHDFLLIAPEAGMPSHETLSNRLADLRAHTERPPAGLEQPLDLQRHYVLGPEELALFARPGPVQRDHDPFLEFSAPRGLYGDATVLDVGALLDRRAALPLPDVPRPDREQALEPAKAADRAMLGGALPALYAAQQQDPEHPGLRAALTRPLYFHGAEALQAGNLDEALASAEQAEMLAPDLLEPVRLRVAVLQASGRPAEAVGAAQQAVQRQSHNVYAWLLLAQTARAAGQENLAEQALAQVHRRDPYLPELSAH